MKTVEKKFKKNSAVFENGKKVENFFFAVFENGKTVEKKIFSFLLFLEKRWRKKSSFFSAFTLAPSYPPISVEKKTFVKMCTPVSKVHMGFNKMMRHITHQRSNRNVVSLFFIDRPCRSLSRLLLDSKRAFLMFTELQLTDII